MGLVKIPHYFTELMVRALTRVLGSASRHYFLAQIHFILHVKLSILSLIQCTLIVLYKG